MHTVIYIQWNLVISHCHFLIYFYFVLLPMLINISCINKCNIIKVFHIQSILTRDTIGFADVIQSFKFSFLTHYTDFIKGVMASQSTSLIIVYSTIYSGTLLAFVRGIHRWLVNSPHKGPVMQKMFPFDVCFIMMYVIQAWPSLCLMVVVPVQC